MGARDDTLAAVGQYWSTAKEIHKRIGCWSDRTVRAVLVLEVHSGAIESRKVPIRSGGFVFEFRLPKTPNGEPDESSAR